VDILLQIRDVSLSHNRGDARNDSRNDHCRFRVIVKKSFSSTTVNPAGHLEQSRIGLRSANAGQLSNTVAVNCTRTLWIDGNGPRYSCNGISLSPDRWTKREFTLCFEPVRYSRPLPC
jgi:hypothetical protein